MKMGFIPVNSRWTEARNDNNDTAGPAATPNPTSNSDSMRRNPRGFKVKEVDAAKCEAAFFADDQPALSWKTKCLCVYELPIFSGHFARQNWH